MSSEIKTLFDEHLKIDVTPALAKAVIHFVNAYETRGTHPAAFNSPYLGLTPCYFLTKDRDDFFNLFDCSEKDIKNLLKRVINGRDKVCGVSIKDIGNELKNNHIRAFQNAPGVTAKDIRHVINEISSLQENYKVASDPFNLFSTYVMHRILSSKLPDIQKIEATHKVIMMLQYKFFTSLVNHRFKYKPDEDIMRAMYEQLTMKFDIKQHGTWRKVMEVRANGFLAKDSLHYKEIESYTNDNKIVYFITDTQTRIRNQINIVTQEFMRVREENIKLGSYSNIGTDKDGEKMLVDGENAWDAMAANTYNDMLAVTRFLDDATIRLVSNLFSNVLTSKFRSFLIQVSELATKQFKSGKSLEVAEENGIVIDIGLQGMVQNIIQKSYRYALLQKVRLDRPVALITCVKDVYSSSRVTDAGIIRVRESVGKMVLDLKVSQRDATNSSYRIAFILYIVLLSLKYNK